MNIAIVISPRFLTTVVKKISSGRCLNRILQSIANSRSICEYQGIRASRMEWVLTSISIHPSIKIFFSSLYVRDE